MSHQFAPKSTFNEVIRLVNSGNTAAAENMCREALHNNRRDINMLGLLGAVLIKMNRLDEAETALRETIRLAPTFAKPHEDLGYLLLEKHRFEEAVAVLENATRLDPESAEAFFNLGKALADSGRGKDADTAFERAFELDPEKRALAIAARHHREGRLKEAERIYRQVLSKNPDNIDAMRLLGVIARSAGRLEDAERLLRGVVEKAPDFAGALIDLGRVLKEQDRFKDAIECFQRAIEISPQDAKAYHLLGSTLAPAALNHEAIAAQRKAVELNPHHPGAWLGLGHGLKTVGQQREAVAAYQRCIALKPNGGETYWSLANLKTYSFSDAEIAEMESRVDREDMDTQSRVNFLFALAKAYEDRGNFEQAWSFYKKGNSIRRMEERYDPVQTETINDRIIEVFSREFLEAHAGEGHTTPAPIFIMGLPRSGSTLLEQILASHSHVEGTAELPYLGRVATSLNRNRADGVNYPEAILELGPQHLRAMGEDYLNYCEMHRKEDRPRYIDKMPNNFPNIGLAHLILPNARIIDARRHPVDACLSCYRQLFAKGQTFTYDLVDIGEYYLQYQRMMDHWHQVLPGRVLTVQYEQIVTDFENQVRRLLEYCRLPWEDACLNYYDTERPVRTASSEQVRQPIYTQSINQWKRYEQHLGELLEVLAPILPRYAEFEAGSGHESDVV